MIFVYEETRKVDTNAFFADEGKVLVLNKNEDVIDELHPQRQTYKSNGMEMTAAVFHMASLETFMSRWAAVKQR